MAHLQFTSLNQTLIKKSETKFGREKERKWQKHQEQCSTFPSSMSRLMKYTSEGQTQT